nr:MAG TPA: hypothetical protein [Caudoviricetes sp.]
MKLIEVHSIYSYHHLKHNYYCSRRRKSSIDNQ